MRLNLIHKDRLRAFTLTELSIVLAVVGIVIGGIWAAAGQVNENNKADQAAQQIMTIVNNVRQTYQGANQFASATQTNRTAAFITAGVVPPELINTAVPTTARNSWSGNVIIWETAGGNPRFFRVSYYSVPVGACARIISKIANLGTNDGARRLLTDNGTDVNITNTGPTAGMTFQNVSIACLGATTIEFDFAIH